MSLTAFLLKALKYPRAEEFSPADYAQYQALVLWLENAKIRHYPIHGRVALQSSDAVAWDSGFKKYLADIECPVELGGDGGNYLAVLEWLLTHAGAMADQPSTAPLKANAPPLAGVLMTGGSELLPLLLLLMSIVQWG